MNILLPFDILDWTYSVVFAEGGQQNTEVP
jgi:hypothetical protein